MGPKQKGRFEACPCARPSPVFLPCVLPLPPFSSLRPTPWRRQLRPGQKRPTKEGRKKNRTRASKRGHNRNQTDPSIPASRSDWLVFPPRGTDHCTKVLPAWGGTTSRRTDEAGFEGMGPDTDALLVGLICGPADLWPDPGSKPACLVTSGTGLEKKNKLSKCDPN